MRKSGVGPRPRQQTAWGEWVKRQPKGVLTRAMRETGLAYSTVIKACRRRVTRDVAEALSRFTHGAVKVRDIVKPSRYAA